MDIVIRNGTIIDGSGGSPFQGDVGITGQHIARVGEVPERGRYEIDASGAIVTPGFVDIHTHYDGQVTWGSHLSPSSSHGVTTVLMGNCGVGFAPCRPDDRDRLIRLMEGVEDIPQVVMAEGLPWNWESFPEYLDALQQRQADVDFATQVPHAAVRVHVMGQRGADREAASAAELERMTELVAEGVRAGAFGVSTSRTLAHRTADGDLAPTIGAGEAELMALAAGLKRADGGVFQLVPSSQEGENPDAEMALFRRIVQASGGRPLSFSLLHTVQFPEHMPRTLALLGEAGAAGLPIRAQVFTRGIGVLMGLELSMHPFRFHPSYREIEGLPLAERVARLRDPHVRRRILSEQPDTNNAIYAYFMAQTAELFPLGNPPNYEPAPDERLGPQAAQRGLSVDELAYDLLLQDEGHGLLLLPASNYVGHTLNHSYDMLAHPDTLVALGDGGAHYGTICDSSYSTHLLAYWTRDRSNGPRFSLPWAVHALSQRNAQAVGFTDRGLLAAGLRADINIIDYDALCLHAPRMVFDLPAGGGRLVQDASGYLMTIKSGEVTYRDGVATGALPGRLLRRRSE
ncbi:N-acyl-D-amino-acid deacylase family protein [Parahaliea mediterranea]|uniref:N-acyl-D-amino-acid deacylase family protein n=1 Tax=Parahaliea mediterranea TaxID=651086 RepID=UPI000E2F8230|nr:amidohydrolase family protein [Parahaliea mediterranea]